MLILVIIWAMSEYHNAGGWCQRPTQGFSQSSGIHDMWNYWIVYPLGAWVLILVAAAGPAGLRRASLVTSNTRVEPRRMPIPVAPVCAGV